MVIPSKRLLALNIRLGLKLTPHFKWNAKDARRVVSLLYHSRKHQHSCSNALSLQESDPTKNAVLLPYLGRWCLMLTVQPRRVQKQLYGLVGNELFSILQLLSHKWNVANHSQLYCYYYQDSYQSWKPWKIDSLFTEFEKSWKNSNGPKVPWKVLEFSTLGCPYILVLNENQNLQCQKSDFLQAKIVL